MTSETHPETTALEPVPPEQHCVACGASVTAGWAFCGSCGAPLPGQASQAIDRAEAQPESSVLTAPVPVLHQPPAMPAPATVQIPSPPPATRGRRWSRGRVTFTALLVLLLCALAGAAGYWQDQTHRQLVAARGDLASTQHKLTARTAALKDTKSQLSGTQSSLDDSQAQVTDLNNRLRQARRQLSGLQGSLSNAQDRLDLQANQIDTLKSCLTGVTSAMGYAAQNDYTAALAALDAVDVSCQRAYDML